jgi:hypothetical protein
VVQHPAGYDSSSPLLLFEKLHGEAVIAFRENRTLGIRNEIVLEAATPRLTRSRAYASPTPLPETVARLATGPGGLTPGRAGFAPAGRRTKFHEVIEIPPIPIDQQSLVALKSLFPLSPIRLNGRRVKQIVCNFRMPIRDS